MLPLLTLWLTVLPLWQSTADPGHITGVQFSGNYHVSADKLTEVFDLNPSESEDSESVREALTRLLTYYRDRGHILASARLEHVERGDSIILVVNVDEGAKYTIGQMSLTGNESVSDDLVRSQMDTRSGQVFSSSLFEKDMERVLRLFEDQGFAFVQVVPEAFSYDTLEHEIMLTLNILEGARVAFAGARFRGYKATKPDYLARESGIKRGDAYSAQRLSDARRRLTKLPFLTSVGEFKPVRALARDMVWAEAEVEEGRANTIYGVLGLDREEEGGLTGLVELSLENLTGRGRGLRAEWRRTSHLTSWLHLAYREPFLLHYDIALQGSFSHHIRDTSYTKSNFALDFETKSMGLLGFEWGFSFERVLPGSYPVPKSRSLGVTAGLWIDTRENPKSEERGVFYSTRSEYALRTNSATDLVLDPEPTANTGKLMFDFLHFVPAVFSTQLYAGLHGREAYTSEEIVPIHDYFFLGGAGSVRGYREEQFSGSRVAWANVEQRFRLSRSSRFYPFLDLGYYQGSVRETIIGYGVGLSVESGSAKLGLDYGLGEGDGPLDGKVHIRLRGLF